MSVGGKVTELIKLEDKVYIDTTDGSESCAIYVELDVNSNNIKIDDIVWWQGKYAYWTTSDRVSKVEIKLNRIGFSGVEKPVK